MDKQKLIDIFELAEIQKCGICIELAMPRQEHSEYIINHYESLKNKLIYYLENYTYDLKHTRDNNVRIINIFLVNIHKDSYGACFIHMDKY